MTAPVDGGAAKVSHPVDRTLSFLKKAARRANDDRGPLRSIGEIKQAVGEDKDAVRGYLIKLLARGDIVLHECINGQAWSVEVDRQSFAPPVPPVVDGHYILQREVIEDGRTFWFDADVFTNFERAKNMLEYQQRRAEYSAREWRNYPQRVQRIRLLQLPVAARVVQP